ncbi:hypothetical protein CBR_g38632 [Chara braunii]|uniref:Uncharacterized protein n=1 Tax=Chara braunii TaxID=69332 RepID=A0A388K0L9_CHABU|nr:hypothetical protein CBR_g38632 [Chara braunii]|eukprot:GBG63566.1 hypothetical protein CBR_g38632 [Chara braunii]
MSRNRLGSLELPKLPPIREREYDKGASAAAASHSQPPSGRKRSNELAPTSRTDVPHSNQGSFSRGGNRGSSSVPEEPFSRSQPPSGRKQSNEQTPRTDAPRSNQGSLNRGGNRGSGSIQGETAAAGVVSAASGQGLVDGGGGDQPPKETLPGWAQRLSGHRRLSLVSKFRKSIRQADNEISMLLKQQGSKFAKPGAVRFNKNGFGIKPTVLRVVHFRPSGFTRRRSKQSADLSTVAFGSRSGTRPRLGPGSDGLLRQKKFLEGLRGTVKSVREKVSWQGDQPGAMTGQQLTGDDKVADKSADKSQIGEEDGSSESRAESLTTPLELHDTSNEEQVGEGVAPGTGGTAVSASGLGEGKGGYFPFREWWKLPADEMRAVALDSLEIDLKVGSTTTQAGSSPFFLPFSCS